MTQSKSDERSEYLLGTDDEELVRLAAQHEVWAEPARSLWKRAGFGEGHTLLDLGCGPGLTTIDLARTVGPAGRVIAVDSSPKFLGHLRARIEALGLRNVEVRESDVHELDLEEQSLDGAYARWVMCFLEDPAVVVAGLARALRPKGALAVTDYFNYRALTFAPRSDVMDRVVDAVQQAWKRRGGDLEVQGRMPGFMIRAGLEVTDITPITSVARPGSPVWRWPRVFFRTFLPTLVEMELITEEDSRAFEREWERREKDPESFLFPPPMFDIIGVKR